MSHQEPHLPEDLRDVADMLSAERPELDPLTLDRIKLQAMRGRRPVRSRGLGLAVRPRLMALLTTGLVAIGGGGALAYAGGGGSFDFGKGSVASAADHQYRPPCPKGEHPKGKHHLCVPDKGLGGYGTLPPPPKGGVKGFKAHKHHKHHKKHTKKLAF
jgi:hypothetical protein